MNPFLRYLADKKVRTDRQTDRHTPMTTRPCGLRRAGNKIGNSCSTSHPVLSGVLQGSVLGPVLFILYVNDICDLAPPGVTIKLFADDAKLCFVFDSAMSLQSCLSVFGQTIGSWRYLHRNVVF